MSAALTAIGASHPLQESRYRIRRLEEQHSVDIPNINTQFERAGSDAQGLVAPAEALLDPSAFPGLEVGIVELGNPSKATLLAGEGEKPVTLPPAVGKDEDLSITPHAVQIIQKAEEFAVLPFELDQVRYNMALRGTDNANRIGAEKEVRDDRVDVSDGGRKRDLLDWAAGPTFQTLQQAG